MAAMTMAAAASAAAATSPARRPRRRSATAEAAAAIGDCGGETTEAEWLEVCELYRFPGACLEAVAEAECSEHDLDMPSYANTCFPSCNTADPFVCNDDDTITVCNEGRQETYYCEAICQAQEVPTAYTGTCATEYMGESSGTGNPVCWCEAPPA